METKGLITPALKAATQGAGVGALQGAGTSDAPVTSGEFIEDIATGAKFGGAAGAVTQLAGRAVTKAQKFFDEFGNEKALKAVTGQNKAFYKKLSDPKKQELGDWLLQKKLVQPLKSVKKTYTEAMELKDEVLDAYKITNQAVDEFAPNAIDGKEISQKIIDYAADLPSDPTSKRIQNRLLEEAEFFEGRGNFGMDEALTLKSTSYRYNPKVDWNNPDKQILGKEGYNLINRAIRDAEDKAISKLSKTIDDPKLKSILEKHKELDDTYSKIATLEDAMEAHVAREQSNSWFGLREQLGGGAAFVASLDPLTTMLAIGAAKGSKKFGNQITAKTAQTLAKAFKNSEQMLGKYGPMLNQAAQRGPASFMATHQLLMSKDDEYREYMNRLNTKKDYGNLPAPEPSYGLNESDNQRHANHYIKSQQGK